MCVAEPDHVLELDIIVHFPRISQRHLTELCCKLSFSFLDMLSEKSCYQPDLNLRQIWWLEHSRHCILFLACIALCQFPMGCPSQPLLLRIIFKSGPTMGPIHLRWWAKNHPLRCLQQGSPHRPFESGYAIPLNSAKRSIVIALGWYKEFQWSRYQK